MFTGIVETTGIVENIIHLDNALDMRITPSHKLSDVLLGESISVNGVCLTVKSLTDSDFSVDIMPETFKATGLGLLQIGSLVNLERALSANGRFGGHFVSGHVDGMGKIVNITPVSNAVNYTIELPKELLRYTIDRGSITVDGISLTIFTISDNTIGLSLIPHTVANTALGIKKVGDIVNIECDLLAKYIEKFVKLENGNV